MAIRQELHRLLDDTLDEDPRRALIAVHRFQVLHLPWLEARAVAKAREHGWNWARIGRLLGRSRQAVRQRYVRLVPSTPARDPAGDHEREWYKIHDDARRQREFEHGDPVAW
ncbi:MAG: hypothetical protein WD225_07305 [Ilumatobacteraceae bacterium]